MQYAMGNNSELMNHLNMMEYCEEWREEVEEEV